MKELNCLRERKKTEAEPGTICKTNALKKGRAEYFTLTREASDNYERESETWRNRGSDQPVVIAS